MEQIQPNVRVIEDYVTSGYLCKFFKRSSLTIHHWRARKGLPYVRFPGDSRDTIRYVIDEVISWAKANDIQMFGDELARDSGLFNANRAV